MSVVATSCTSSYAFLPRLEPVLIFCLSLVRRSLGEELYDHTGDDGTDFDKFPIGHANLAGRPAMAAQLNTHRKILASFFRDKNEAVAFMDFDTEQ